MSVEDQKYRKLLSKIYLGQTDTTEKQFIKAMLKRQTV